LKNWFRCPFCGKPLLKITDKSIVRNEIYCRCCKTSFDVEIEGLEVKKAAAIKKVS
jgi:transcription elongation factor Elf1